MNNVFSSVCVCDVCALRCMFPEIKNDVQKDVVSLVFFVCVKELCF